MFTVLQFKFQAQAHLLGNQRSGDPQTPLSRCITYKNKTPSMYLFSLDAIQDWYNKIPLVSQMFLSAYKFPFQIRLWSISCVYIKVAKSTMKIMGGLLAPPRVGGGEESDCCWLMEGATCVGGIREWRVGGKTCKVRPEEGIKRVGFVGVIKTNKVSGLGHTNEITPCLNAQFEYTTATLTHQKEFCPHMKG